MRRILLFSLALFAACAPHSAAPPQAGVTTANFRDADPHEWQGKTPAAYQVHGIDLSKFQTSVDWSLARANGVNFAFVKATEGGDGLDPMFADHWRAAKRNGVARGAYHFFYHCRPALEQARWFIAHVPRSSGDLPPVLDMEWTPRSPTCRIRRDAATLRAEARIFLDALQAHYGTRPILYTAIDFYQDNQLWLMQDTEFWLRSTAAHPGDLYQGQAWTFWQYSGTGQTKGIKGHVDLNAFSGSPTAWTEWRTRRSQP